MKEAEGAFSAGLLYQVKAGQDKKLLFEISSDAFRLAGRTYDLEPSVVAAVLDEYLPQAKRKKKFNKLAEYHLGTHFAILAAFSVAPSARNAQRVRRLAYHWRYARVVVLLGFLFSMILPMWAYGAEVSGLVVILLPALLNMLPSMLLKWHYRNARAFLRDVTQA